MKKIIAILLAAILLLSLAACNNQAPGGGDGSAPSGGSPPVEHSAQTEASQQPGAPPDDGGPTQTAPPVEPASPEPAHSGSEASAPERPLKPDLPQEAPVIRDRQAEIHALWETLRGCWTATDERFAYFTYEDGEPAFFGGIWESEALFRRGNGLVTGLVAHSDREYTVIVTYPPVEDGNAADEQETREMVWSFELDVGREGIDETLRLNDADGVTRQYAWGGVSYDDAYDSVHDIQYASFEEMQPLWSELTGYWNSEDGNRFVIFDQEDSNTLLFQEGVWDSGGGRGWGTYEKSMTAMGEIPMEFIIYYPTTGDENHIDGLLPELSQPVWLDITDLYTKERIYLKIGNYDEWTAYIYSEKTAEEAGQSTELEVTQ